MTLVRFLNSVFTTFDAIGEFLIKESHSVFKQYITLLDQKNKRTIPCL